MRTGLVEPLGLGTGRVELLHSTRRNETHENVAACGSRTAAADRRALSRSRLKCPTDSRYRRATGRCKRRPRYRETAIPPLHAVPIDFAGAALEGLGEDEVEAVASGNANVRGLRANAFPNTATQGWRVTLDFERIDPKQPVELRAFLRSGSRTLSETWSHAAAPE